MIDVGRTLAPPQRGPRPPNFRERSVRTPAPHQEADEDTRATENGEAL